MVEVGSVVTKEVDAAMVKTLFDTSAYTLLPSNIDADLAIVKQCLQMHMHLESWMQKNILGGRKMYFYGGRQAD